MEFVHMQGHDFPDDLSSYQLVIHCGACMWNRREMLARIARCKQANVPITNYGMTIAYSLGIFERALEPFPAAAEAYRALALARGALSPRRDGRAPSDAVPRVRLLSVLCLLGAPEAARMAEALSRQLPDSTVRRPASQARRHIPPGR